MHISELETPAVVVDLDVMERNLSRMADYCREHQLLLRPHTKSHKIPELAKRQIASGATGITVAKIGEAEVMLDAGIDDMLIAYPIVGAEKTARLARIAEQAKISVSLDSEEAAREISAAATRQGTTIGILVEMDVGFGRCGLSNETDLRDAGAEDYRASRARVQRVDVFSGSFRCWTRAASHVASPG